ncbi:MAG: class I SAM-dependent methyltransferase [Acidiferrobacteraceae bacterium]
MTALKGMLRRLPGMSASGRQRPEQWDLEYQNGRWDYLRGVDELAHYSVIAGYCRHFIQGGSIWDVGCGEGILCNVLDDSCYSFYLGTDFSEQAISRAVGRVDGPKRMFRVADMHDFDPQRRFNMIVFNESLYYSQAPANVLRRHAAFLEPDGLLVVSMYLSRRSPIWNEIRSVGRLLDEVQIRNRNGTCWTCQLLAAHATPA